MFISFNIVFTGTGRTQAIRTRLFFHPGESEHGGIQHCRWRGRGYSGNTVRKIKGAGGLGDLNWEAVAPVFEESKRICNWMLENLFLPCIPFNRGGYSRVEQQGAHSRSDSGWRSPGKSRSLGSEAVVLLGGRRHTKRVNLCLILVRKSVTLMLSE